MSTTLVVCSALKISLFSFSRGTGTGFTTAAVERAVNLSASGSVFESLLGGGEDWSPEDGEAAVFIYGDVSESQKSPVWLDFGLSAKSTSASILGSISIPVRRAFERRFLFARVLGAEEALLILVAPEGAGSPTMREERLVGVRVDGKMASRSSLSAKLFELLDLLLGFFFVSADLTDGDDLKDVLSTIVTLSDVTLIELHVFYINIEKG